MIYGCSLKRKQSSYWKRWTWDNGRKHWPQTPLSLCTRFSVYFCMLFFFSFKGMSSNGNYPKYTSTICMTILKEVSLIYHSLKLLHLCRHANSFSRNTIQLGHWTDRYITLINYREFSNKNLIRVDPIWLSSGNRGISFFEIIASLPPYWISDGERNDDCFLFKEHL
jgi:hypothetical protein